MRSSIVAVLAFAALSAVSCVSRTQYMGQVNRVRGLTDTLNKLRPYLDQLEDENRSLQSEVSRYKKTATDAAWVAEQKEKLARLVAELEKQGGGAGIPGVEVFENKEGDVGIRIDEMVLFASGKDALSGQGQETLARLVPILTKGNRQVRIDGHTDSDPIVRSGHKSNLHLSVKRAIAVAEALNGHGIPFDKLLVAGFGPTRPASPTEKARNRRVELYLQ